MQTRDRSLFSTGDIRAKGRKDLLFDELVANPTSEIERMEGMHL